MSTDDAHGPTSPPASGPTPGPDRGGRRLRRGMALLVVVAVWVWLCFVWLFPWLTELGLDPTLGG